MANDDIIKKVKEIVHRYDTNAQVILFGSRARGDYEAESDWDFLILTEKEYSEDLFKKIRSAVWEEIELASLQNVQTIIKNKNDWENKYWVTDLYESIKEEGVVV